MWNLGLLIVCPLMVAWGGGVGWWGGVGLDSVAESIPILGINGGMRLHTWRCVRGRTYLATSSFRAQKMRLHTEFVDDVGERCGCVWW